MKPLLDSASPVLAPALVVDSAPLTLVWSDEFDYEGLPDPTKWTFDEGFIRNEELQYYTNGRLHNARVTGGRLVIEAHHERHPNPKYQAGSTDWRFAREAGEYTSAAIHTAGKADWTYGRIEVRAKFPPGRGLWPAVWTLGTDITIPGTGGWPRCGEIDVIEYVGSEPDIVHGTVHFHDGTEHRSIGKRHRIDGLCDGFHTYTVDWLPDRLDFGCDGEIYHSVPMTDCDPSGLGSFNRPHFLIINLALGGKWAGEVDSANLPQQLLVEHVRVYQQGDALIDI